MMTLMEQEARTAPEVVARQFSENIQIIQALCQHLKKHPPAFIFTIARGSSDHAAYFGNYLAAIETGLLTASLPPSLNSIYHCRLQVKNALAIAISQSGASPDICDSLQAAKEAGATTVAIVNNTESLLASIADFVIPMHAGKENAVAATKSFLASLSALIQFFAHYAQNKTLLKALPLLPERLQQALDTQWEIVTPILEPVVNLITLGRGLNYPITEEVALKFKETANIHAESFSAAEFQHGPMALARDNFPLLVFAQQDASLASVLALTDKMTNLGVNTMIAAAKNIDILAATPRHILLPESLHPACDPLVSIQAFYPMMARLAVTRGYNPDKPENLQKVTQTR